MRSRHGGYIWRLVVLAHLYCSFAHAQEFRARVNEVHQSEHAESKNKGVEKQTHVVRIVVTQKREQSATDVPVAITAITGTELDAAGVSDVQELGAITTGLTVGVFNLGQPQIYMRGVGSNEDGAGGDNSVPVFIDQVYIGRASASLVEFYDIDRVEVLRGPQGTLYGKNVAGGAINVYSRQANEPQDSAMDVRIGSLNNYRWRGSVFSQSSTEIAGLGQLYGKFSWLGAQREGYIESAYGFKQNDKNDTGFKTQIVSEPNDVLSIFLDADYLSQHQTGAGRYPDGGVIGNIVLPAIDPSIHHTIFRNYVDVIGYQDKRLKGVHLRANGAFAFDNIRWISAWREHEFQFANDHLAISPQEYALDIVNYGDEQSTQLSHEWQWQTSRIADWDWLFGLYYLSEETQRLEGFQSTLAPTGISWQNTKTNSNAVYFHGIYTINNDWQVAIGLRQSNDEKKVHQRGQAGFIISQSYDEFAHAQWRNTSPMASLMYHWSATAMSYLTYVEGYKAGGFQGQAPTAVAAKTPFNEERANNWELGFKLLWPEQNSALNVALFDMDYQDLQILELMQTPTDPIGVVVTQNAASAYSRGIECEYVSDVGEHWRVHINYAYLDAAFDRFYLHSSDARVGNRLRNAPEHSGSIALSYHFSTGTLSDAFIRYDHRFQDKVYQDPANLEGSAIDAFQLANLRVQSGIVGSSWGIALWINNVWDDSYFIHKFPIGAVTNPATPALPRTYGLDIRYRF